MIELHFHAKTAEELVAEIGYLARRLLPAQHLAAVVQHEPDIAHDPVPISVPAVQDPVEPVAEKPLEPTDIFPPSDKVGPSAGGEPVEQRRRGGRPRASKQESQPQAEVVNEPAQSADETAAAPAYTLDDIKQRVREAIDAFKKQEMSDVDQVAKMAPLFKELGSAKGASGLPADRYGEFMERSKAWLEQ